MIFSFWFIKLKAGKAIQKVKEYPTISDSKKRKILDLADPGSEKHQTPLMVAASCGYLGIVEKLIAAGGRPSFQTQFSFVDFEC